MYIFSVILSIHNKITDQTTISKKKSCRLEPIRHLETGTVVWTQCSCTV